MQQILKKKDKLHLKNNELSQLMNNYHIATGKRKINSYG